MLADQIDAPVRDLEIYFDPWIALHEFGQQRRQCCIPNAVVEASRIRPREYGIYSSDSQEACQMTL